MKLRASVSQCLACVWKVSCCTGAAASCWGCASAGAEPEPEKSPVRPAPMVWPTAEPTATPAAVEAICANKPGCCGAACAGACAAGAGAGGACAAGAAMLDAERDCTGAGLLAGPLERAMLMLSGLEWDV